MSDLFVSVIAPLFQTAGFLRDFVAETHNVLRANYANYEIVLIDDGSTDDTAALIDSLLEEFDCIRYLRLSRHYGDEIAISAGLDTVIGDFVVIMKPDSDPPARIPAMVDLARDGCDMVYGVQQNPPRRSWPVRLGAALFHWYCRRFLNFELTRNVTHFRVLSRQAVNALTQIKDRHRYLRFSSQYVGFVSESYPYSTIQRVPDAPGPGLGESLSLAINVIVSASKHPLRMVTWFGILAGLLNALYVGYVVLVYFLREHVAEGWTTMSLQQALMFLFVFIILTILSEYVGQILDETQHRPLYYTLEERNSRVMLADGDRYNVVNDPVGDEPDDGAGRT